MIEPIDNDPQQVKSVLLSKQHTILWNNEKYLSLAPGMNRPVVALGYNEHAEELSFPSIIYLGKRQFNQRVYTMLLKTVTRKTTYEQKYRIQYTRWQRVKFVDSIDVESSPNTSYTWL